MVMSSAQSLSALCTQLLGGSHGATRMAPAAASVSNCQSWNRQWGRAARQKAVLLVLLSVHAWSLVAPGTLVNEGFPKHAPLAQWNILTHCLCCRKPGSTYLLFSKCRPKVTRLLKAKEKAAFGKILLPRIQSSQISELDATLLPLGRWGDLPLTWGFPLGTHKHTDGRSTGQAPFPQPLTGLCLSWSSPKLDLPGIKSRSEWKEAGPLTPPTALTKEIKQSVPPNSAGREPLTSINWP